MDEHRSGPVVWCAIIGATCLLLVLMEQMLWLAIPFVLGVVLYYVLLPPTQRLLRMGMRKNAAVPIVFAAATLLTVLVVLATASWASAPSTSGQEMVARYVTGGLSFLRRTLQGLEHEFRLLRQIHLSEAIDASVAAWTEDFLKHRLAGVLVAAAGWIPSLLLAPFLTFFFLRDGRRFKRFLVRAVPNAFFERTLFLLHEVDQTARRYFIGMMKLTVIDTAALALGLWAIGLNGPLVLGFIAALLAWVPYVGSIAGCAMVVMVASTDAPDNTLIAYGAIAVFIAVRLLDDFIFMPLTIGRSLHIHPLIAVLMIFIGGSVAGVAGLMLVLPLLGIVSVVGQTLGELVTNGRLRARHRYTLALRTKQASADL
ncbi:AI-2E family transporter [Pseudoduganella sp. UC29_106]|uniref:AI-2E family transporter n=1 Tax=Pseudoduganella sp. UC29_106 TaxID=3374553 RepID=UPI003756F95B